MYPPPAVTRARAARRSTRITMLTHLPTCPRRGARVALVLAGSAVLWACDSSNADDDGGPRDAGRDRADASAEGDAGGGPPGLRESVARRQRLRVGTAVAMAPLADEPTYREVLAREFDYVTPENVMKWDVIEPVEGEFHFEQADELIAFAEEHGQEIKGHNLVWHFALPTWVKDIDDPDRMREVLVRHVRTEVEHFRGRVRAWDVVNEAADELTGEYEPSVFYRVLGPEYLALAYETAHAADPDAILIYNDWGTELVGPKFDFALELARSLHERGLCDEIGFQMHVPLTSLVTLDQVRTNFRRVAEAGLRFNISELDLGLKHEPGNTDAERRASQAERYHDLVAACVDEPACDAVTFWGFTDKYSWVDMGSFPGAGPGNEPLLFDEHYERKATWHAVARALRGE